MRGPETGGFSFEATPDAIAAVEAGHPEGNTAERFRAELRVAAEAMLGSPEALARAIGEKLLAKVHVKEQVESMLDGADDPTVRQEFKKLGIFVVREQQAQFSYEDPATGFRVELGDALLDLHLPPVPEGMRSATAVRDSLSMIAKYIQLHGLEPKYIMGITYERMGRFAERRFDFNVVNVDPSVLPEDALQGVANVYANTGLVGEMGYPAVVYRDTQAFLDQYS